MDRVQALGARYSVSAFAWSNLRMRASLDQTSLEPGSTAHLRAVLTEYGLPVDGRATVRAGCPGRSFTAIGLPGGDNPLAGPSGDDGRKLCDLLTCLTKVSAKALKRNGINPEEVLRCVQQHCASAKAGVPR